jgi:hypothetical protein
MTDSVKQPNTTTRTIDLGAEMKKYWGAEWARADLAYMFSTGRKFDNSDRSESGVYSHD